MFSKIFKHIALPAILLGSITVYSCIDNLSTAPIDEDVITSARVYNSPSDFRQVLAKLYAGFATTGQQGPAGNADIQGIDEGFSSYLRQFWVHQIISTDEAVVAWNDPGLPEFNFQAWDASNDFVMAMYSRIFYNIALANEFIREAQKRDEAVIKTYEAEARFIRALSYWHALDLFGGGIPFVTENDPVGAYMPEPTTNRALFDWIESELIDIQDKLPAPRQNQYGRADQGAVWTLLSKLNLNAQVYVNENRYTEAINYASRVIDQGGYSLVPDYSHLFLADNSNLSEIIFPIRFDGNNIRTWGGTTFIVHAAVGGNMNVNDYGIDFGWGGHRVTPQFVSKFDDSDRFSGIQTENTGGFPEIYVPGGYQSASGYGNDWSPEHAPALISENSDNVYSGLVYFANAGSEFKFTAERNWGGGDWGGSGGVLQPGGSNLSIPSAGVYTITVNLNNLTYSLAPGPSDSRAMFHTDGQNLEIEDWRDFTNGYAVTKWKNITSTGVPGSHVTFVDNDFPMFRLADVYLIYAEAVLRGGQGGSSARAVELMNEIRTRAYGDESGNITASDLTLQFILDERARELYWEGHRRTDLIRFGQYTTENYVWSWKGNARDGSGTSDHRKLFPIPSSDINANLNLRQNPGY